MERSHQLFWIGEYSKQNALLLNFFLTPKFYKTFHLMVRIEKASPFQNLTFLDDCSFYLKKKKVICKHIYNSKPSTRCSTGIG